ELDLIFNCVINTSFFQDIIKGFSELSSGIVISHIVGAIIIGDVKYLHHWCSPLSL
ncbi:6373_t:CDS:2, partial [Racocetra persica]